MSGITYQINQWVFGLEGSVDGTSLSNTAAAFFPDGTTITAQSKADIQGSIRGRLGIAWDRGVDLCTGGVAFGGFNTNVSIANTGAVTGNAVLANGSGFRAPGWAGRLAAASTMQSPTIGRSLPSTAIRIGQHQ